MAQFGEGEPAVLVRRIEIVDVRGDGDIVTLRGVLRLDGIDRSPVLRKADVDVGDVGQLPDGDCRLGLAAVGVAEYKGRRAGRREIVVLGADPEAAFVLAGFGEDAEPLRVVRVAFDGPFPVRPDDIARHDGGFVADDGLDVEAQFRSVGDVFARGHLLQPEISSSARRIVVVARYQPGGREQERHGARCFPEHIAEYLFRIHDFGLLRVISFPRRLRCAGRSAATASRHPWPRPGRSTTRGRSSCCR